MDVVLVVPGTRREFVDFVFGKGVDYFNATQMVAECRGVKYRCVMSMKAMRGYNEVDVIFIGSWMDLPDGFKMRQYAQALNGDVDEEDQED